MKKFLVSILVLVYLAVSGGVAINIHYCMGQVASVDLMHNSDKCGKCGMLDSENDCCKDEFKMVKVEDSHKLISNDININTPIALIDNSKSSFDTDLLYTLLGSEYNNHSPPEPPAVSLYILYNVFRI